MKMTEEHNSTGKRDNMLELKNVSFLVDAEGKDKEIIRNVSLMIPDRKLVVVTGPNGGGKSTLAKLIAGIEKPTGGRIFFNGEDITELNVTDRALKGIAYAFQQPVRFKGIRVLDLIRIAAVKTLSVSDACQYLSSVGLCARDYVDRMAPGGAFAWAANIAGTVGDKVAERKTKLMTQFYEDYAKPWYKNHAS